LGVFRAAKLQHFCSATAYLCKMDLLEWMNAAVIQPLQQSDRLLMLKINREWTFSALDHFTLFMRNAKMHIPLYLFFFYFAFKKMGRKAWFWLLSAVLLISVSDLISSQMIKPFFARPRPCRDPFFSSQVRLLASYCGANGSFTSSHAVNHFAIATFTVGTIGQGYKQFRWLYVWAALIAYSQVYVGVHYPTDVLFGSILGIVFGWMAVRLCTQPLSLRDQV
jgi:membrane-associated phospholipid phosphatase